MRLPRPYIPLRVKVQVAERQFREQFGEIPVGSRRQSFFIDGDVRSGMIGSVWLKVLLKRLFGDDPVELHHRPALVNRERVWVDKYVQDRDGCNAFVGYIPDANDPDYLVYLPADEHDTETRVRGLHGQHSDLALARKRKRKERKVGRPKRIWPSRPLRSRNNLRRR